METSTQTNRSGPSSPTQKPPTQKEAATKQDWPRSLNPWSRRGVIPWARRKLPYLKDEFQHLADQFWNFAEDELFSGEIRPAADIAETADAIIVTMDVPGFDPDEIDVQVTENAITIRGQREPDGCDEDDDVFLRRAERRYGKFSRTFAIPHSGSGEVNARCRNGVLTVRLIKARDANSRKIPVDA